MEESVVQEIRKKYPGGMSKEQLYKVCHISKRVAKYYLDNGIIPCEDNGHSTHKYMVRTEDVIIFLQRREQSPDMYKVTVPSNSKQEPVAIPGISYDERTLEIYRGLLNALLLSYPDLMTVNMVSEATGYSTKTVLLWRQYGYLQLLRDGVHYYIPKSCVVEHMMSESFRTISVKSQKHRWLLRQLASKLKSSGSV